MPFYHPLELLFLLVAMHFVCDYVFQTSNIAIGKNRKTDECYLGVDWYYWMTSHAATHALGVYLITRSPILALFEMFTHFVIDCMKCEGRLHLHQDQILHLVMKLGYVAFYIALTA